MREPDGAVAVAAIKALTAVLKRSTATTMMGVQKELNDAAASLQKSVYHGEDSAMSNDRQLLLAAENCQSLAQLLSCVACVCAVKEKTRLKIAEWQACAVAGAMRQQSL